MHLLFRSDMHVFQLKILCWCAEALIKSKISIDKDTSNQIEFVTKSLDDFLKHAIIQS